MLVATIGFHLAFRQRLIRRWWNRIVGGSPVADPAEEDPVHYALIISGMMIMAFGILILVFMSAFALFSLSQG